MSPGTGGNGLYNFVGIGVYYLYVGTFHIGDPHFTRHTRYRHRKKQKCKAGNRKPRLP
jgi:hypothetical protein